MLFIFHVIVLIAPSSNKKPKDHRHTDPFTDLREKMFNKCTHTVRKGGSTICNDIFYEICVLIT